MNLTRPKLNFKFPDFKPFPGSASPTKPFRKASKSRKIQLNLAFKEEQVTKRVTKRIKKKTKKPFRNIRKIMNIIYQQKSEGHKNVSFDADVKEDLNILYLIILKLIMDNKIGSKSAYSKTPKAFEAPVDSGLENLGDFIQTQNLNRQKAESKPLVTEHESHQEFLRFYLHNKDQILNEMKEMFIEKKFAAVNSRFLSGLLNDNNSLYLFMGLLVKFIQTEITNFGHESPEKAEIFRRMINNIRTHFFGVVLKKKQLYKNQMKMAKQKKNLGIIPEESASGRARINSSSVTEDSSRKSFDLEYSSTFLKLMEEDGQLKKLTQCFLEKYFAGDEQVKSMIFQTIEETNKEKMNIIINLSRSLACIKTNDNNKIFSILKCLFQSNDLLRPVSFPEINDAFLNVHQIILKK